ncbi:MAG: bifunctional diaminohydroxyphosphoribosylaminopyrimidine deaminase/5-amino-6-(5-phosphoribosylamino)uracil reductase RibD [Candidatus Zixiibacteriota bacterium]
MGVKADPTGVDIKYMQRALSLASRAKGHTSPNPMVGAVVVKNGRIIAEGYHKRAGGAHAEAAALEKAGSAARGATVYVSLEPCCHTGLTGPCTEKIIDGGVRKVVYAVKDPDSRVNGRGVRILRKAGIEVVGNVLKEDAVRLNEIYFGNKLHKRPYIILKTVQSLDGRIATATGDSQWISSPESLKLAHELRAEVDAVVVGMGTVRADNPSLTVRRVKGKNPYRIIVSGSLKFPSKCNLLDNNSDFKTIVASSEKAIERFRRNTHRSGLIFWNVKTGRDGMLDIKDFVRKAADFGLCSLLIEGGGELVTSFLKAGLFDKYIVITAPVVIGRGADAVRDLHSRKLSDALKLKKGSCYASGCDMVFIGYPERKK